MGDIVLAGATSGTVTLHPSDVAGTTTLTLPATNGTLVTTASGQALTSPTITGTATLNGVNMTPYTMKNRIINGGMIIDQRNAGASVTPTNNQYTVDRWAAEVTQASKFTVQQVSGNANTAQGFTQSLRVTSSSAYSVISSDVFDIKQQIEGYNIADFVWGTANAKTVTLSFWVYSSLTGTFGGSLTNDGSYSYAFSYTISSANTWTQVSITIAGSTAGSWNSTNGTGLYVRFNLGCGSNYLGTANTWVASNTVAPTGSQSIVGTNGATWYLTGVQLELGSAATAFEWRPYGNELALCQRYYWKTDIIYRLCIISSAGNGFQGMIQMPVSMRASPTASVSYTVDGGGGSITSSGVATAGTILQRLYAGVSNTSSTVYLDSGSTFTSEL